MKKLTLAEKVTLTSGQGNWHLFESDSIEGRRINVADGPHGVRVYEKPVAGGDFSNKRAIIPATLFPSASAMASTWNRSLLEKIGRTIGKECRYHQVDVLLAPGMNLKRSPLGGRNFEYYSEDPFLTSEMGQAFVRGIQSEQVGACIKHFGLNEQETMRRFVNVNVDERTMHEMYLYPFYQVIKKENPWMVMSSYNKLNGHYASESSYLLKDVLRHQWGYDGVVVSDWGAVQNKVKSIKNGMNIEMPGPSHLDDRVKTALENGTLSEAELDESLAPVFALHAKTKDTQKLEAIDLDQHHEVAREVASEAIILLENDGILPITDTKQKLGVIGAFAKHPRINGGGSSTVRPFKQEVPHTELTKVFDNLTYAPGYQESDTDETLITEASEVARNSDTVFFFTGTTAEIETEGKDRDHMSLPQGHLEVFEAIRKVNRNIVVILSNGSALDLRAIKPHSRAILETWFLGGAAANAIIDVITGKVNPSGRLQETFPLRLEHTPHYGTFPPLVEIDYHQDLIMNGYRYYDTHQYDVLYPFGYGLSYADIVYKAITWDINPANKDAVVTLSITLKNTSAIGAHETPQVYLGTAIDTLIKPVKELKGFEKVFLAAKEEKTIRIALPLEAFETYDESQHGFVVYNGTYSVHVGRHSRDIHDTRKVVISDQTGYQPRITFDYPVKFLKLYAKEWFDHIEKHYRPLRWHETEAPIWRILERYQQHKNISDAKMTELISNIKAALKS